MSIVAKRASLCYGPFSGANIWRHHLKRSCWDGPLGICWCSHWFYRGKRKISFHKASEFRWFCSGNEVKLRACHKASCFPPWAQALSLICRDNNPVYESLPSMCPALCNICYALPPTLHHLLYASRRKHTAYEFFLVDFFLLLYITASLVLRSCCDTDGSWEKAASGFFVALNGTDVRKILSGLLLCQVVLWLFNI